MVGILGEFLLKVCNKSLHALKHYSDKCFTFVFLKGILKKIIDATTVGTTARTLCQMGDNLIEEETSKVFKKEKELKKGRLHFLFVIIL